MREKSGEGKIGLGELGVGEWGRRVGVGERVRVVYFVFCVTL